MRYNENGRFEYSIGLSKMLLKKSCAVAENSNFDVCDVFIGKKHAARIIEKISLFRANKLRIIFGEG